MKLGGKADAEYSDDCQQRGRKQNSNHELNMTKLFLKQSRTTSFSYKITHERKFPLTS